MAGTKKENYQPGEKYPIVKASFDLEANRQNYQRLLTHLSGLQVTKDNVNEDHTKEAREVRKLLKEKKEQECKPVLQHHADILKAYSDLDKPLEEQINRLLAEKQAVADAIRKENEAQLREQTRVANAKAAIINFTNKIANDIRNANTDADIVSVEKMIGLEKTKKNLYQEFIPDLITQLDNLRPHIREQKENVRRLQELNQKEKEAIEKGEIYEATAIREEKEYVQTVIEHTGIKIHEKAFEEAIKIEVVVPDVVEIAPKGRTNWKWEVTDIKLLQKKMPHLVKMVPDDAAIDLLLKTKRQGGELDDVEEQNWNGIRFFNDRKFSK